MQKTKMAVEELLRQHNEMDSDVEDEVYTDKYQGKTKKKPLSVSTREKRNNFVRNRRKLSSLVISDLKNEDIMTNENVSNFISIGLDDIKGHTPIQNEEHLDLLDLIISYPEYKEKQAPSTSNITIQQSSVQETNNNKKCTSSVIISTLILTLIVLIIVGVVGYFLYANSSRDSIKKTSLYWSVGILILLFVVFAVILYAKVKR